MLKSPASPDDSLSEHLMVYYWRGQLTFEGKDGLLENFYTQASDGVRGHAMWFVGRSVAGSQDAAPPEGFERLKNLMELRLRVIEQNAATAPFTKELAAFGWWFTADKLDDEWSLEMLLKVLHRTKTIDGGMDVVKMLAGLSSRHPVAGVACLILIASSYHDNW